MFGFQRFATLVLLFAAFAVMPLAVHGQRRSGKHPAEPKKPPELKQDLLVLRYKPQAGTLLYDVRTEIDQHIRTDRDELSGDLIGTAQLAFHAAAIDYKADLWSFDRYFTNFQIVGHELNGDSLSLNENRAVNKITRLMYDMEGHEIENTVIDTIRLLNAEAQTHSYFFQPPRMLIPLPEKAVTYGATWVDHSLDTVHVRDTVNIGITTGEYRYDVYRTYRLAALIDTLNLSGDTGKEFLALIVASDSGLFEGEQFNSVTEVTTKSHGPLSGADTTYLDLFSGRVVKRTLRMHIPAAVEVSSATPFTDFLDVRSVVELSESNATNWRNARQ